MRERIQDAEQARAALRAASVLRADEAPVDALDRTRKDLDASEQRLRELVDAITISSSDSRAAAPTAGVLRSPGD